WREILGVRVEGVEDNFFELGGHSLMAMQVISRVARAFGVELPVSVIFERPTIAGLAESIEQKLNQPVTKVTTIRPRTSRQQAEQLLAQLENLSEAEVDALLVGLGSRVSNV